MAKLIIYNQDNGILAIVMPNLTSGLSVEQIAKISVPKGKKYKIIEDSDLPTDRTFREAWVVSESDLTDGIGEQV